VLIGNVQTNFGVIWHFVFFLYNSKSKMLALNTKFNTDRLYHRFMLTINLVFILRKGVNYSVNFLSNRIIK